MRLFDPPAIFLKGSRIGVHLIHGLTGTPAEMLTLAKRLHKYGFTVSCPVLPGHCGSYEDLRATTWPDWVRGVEQGLSHLRDHADILFVGGLSAGAVLSLHMALRHPDVIRGMGLYSITLKWDGWSIPKLSFLLPLVLRLPYIGKRYHFVEAFPYGIKNDKLRRRIVAKMQSGDPSAAGHTNTPGFIVRELWRLVDDIKPRFGDIHAPALVVHADQDDIAGLRSNALYVCKHLAGPTELLRLYNSYHMVTVDQERHAVADATARFFSAQLTTRERQELARHAVAGAAVPQPDDSDAAPRSALVQAQETT